MNHDPVATAPGSIFVRHTLRAILRACKLTQYPMSRGVNKISWLHVKLRESDVTGLPAYSGLSLYPLNFGCLICSYFIAALSFPQDAYAQYL